MTSDVEYLFMCLLAVGICSLEKGLILSIFQSDWSLILSCMGSLYIFSIKSKTFFHSVECFFILLMVPFAVQKVFSFLEPYLFIFTFVFGAAGVICKESLPKPMLRSFFPTFTSRSFTVPGPSASVFV